MKLIESILSSENVIKAQSRVISNKGGAGIDGMHVDALVEYMRTNWMGIKESILARKYKPAPVRRVEIPKPNGGVRKLGIPTVLDRTIQQAIVLPYSRTSSKNIAMASVLVGVVSKPFLSFLNI